MECETKRKGKECTLMSEKVGCTYGCEPIVYQCTQSEDNKDCSHIVQLEDGFYCTIYSRPDIKWNSDCPMDSRVSERLEEEEKETKKKRFQPKAHRNINFS